MISSTKYAPPVLMVGVEEFQGVLALTFPARDAISFRLVLSLAEMALEIKPHERCGRGRAHDRVRSQTSMH